MQSNAKQYKTMQSNAKQSKAIQSNAKQCEATPGNAPYSIQLVVWRNNWHPRLLKVTIAT